MKIVISGAIKWNTNIYIYIYIFIYKGCTQLRKHFGRDGART